MVVGIGRGRIARPSHKQTSPICLPTIFNQSESDEDGRSPEASDAVDSDGAVRLLLVEMWRLGWVCR